MVRLSLDRQQENNMSQTPFNIQRAAVIGAGTMGRGIVMCLANAGVRGAVGR